MFDICGIVPKYSDSPCGALLIDILFGCGRNFADPKIAK